MTSLLRMQTFQLTLDFSALDTSKTIPNSTIDCVVAHAINAHSKKLSKKFNDAFCYSTVTPHNKSAKLWFATLGKVYISLPKRLIFIANNYDHGIYTNHNIKNLGKITVKFYIHSMD